MMSQPTIPPQPEPSGITLSHDARAIHDIATLSIAGFTRGGGGFVAALMTPDQGSGNGIVPGAYMDADTGELVVPRGASMVIPVSGKWQVIAASSGGQNGGAYSWSDPVVILKRIHEPEDVYSPFARGGAIVFRPHGASGAKDFFEDTRLLFTTWSDDFSTAVRFAEENPAVFSEDANKVTDSQLRPLLAGSNRFLAVDAFRRWLGWGRLPLPVGEQYLVASPDSRVKSILAYLLVARGDDLLRLTDATQDTTALKAMALGAWSAKMLAGHKVEVARCANTALAGQRKRLADLGVPIKSDPTLAAIFQHAL
jgi:hypothetical protein